jgi:hypothetical protein
MKPYANYDGVIWSALFVLLEQPESLMQTTCSPFSAISTQQTFVASHAAAAAGADALVAAVLLCCCVYSCCSG